MENRKKRIIISHDTSREMMRFSVELAHIIGFASSNIEFPIVCEDELLVNKDTLYFGIGKVQSINNIVNIDCKSDWAGEWTKLYKRYMFSPNNNVVQRPLNYVSASENSFMEGECVNGGLERMFDKGWILQDKDRDGVSDYINCRFLLPDDADRYLYIAACDIAARFGMEATSIKYPLLTGKDDGSSNIVEFKVSDIPCIKLIQTEPRIVISIEGSGKELVDFVSKFSNRFPITEGYRRLSSVFEYFQQVFSMQNADGQATYMDTFEVKNALLSAEANIDKFRKKWPGSDINIYNDSFEAEKRQYDIPCEVDDLRDLMKSKVYPLIKPGDKVEILGALWQDRLVRSDLEKEFSNHVKECGAQVLSSNIICAYKQGLSWVEEVFSPKAANIGSVNHVVIRYNPYLRHGDLNEEETLKWKNINDKFDKPPRWLEELYPVDTLIAPILGISEDAIAFEAFESNINITYEAVAYDKDGNCLLKDSYLTRVSERLFLDEFPEQGPSLPATGFIKVKVNNETIVNEGICTDCEKIWDTYQQNILPWVTEHVKKVTNGRPSCELQPFFSRLELDVGIGGPERIAENCVESICSGEVLHENLHQIGHMYFALYGQRTCGNRFNAPGLILPKIHIRAGKPTLKATIKMPFGRANSFEHPKCFVYCNKISVGSNGLELWMSVSLPKKYKGLIDSYAALVKEGFIKIPELKDGYGAVHIVHEETGVSATIELGKSEKVIQNLSICDVDLMAYKLIGYDNYVQIINQLKRVPELYVSVVGQSYQGRSIYAIQPRRKTKGYVSYVKLLQEKPTLFINGRHHANEVSATNAAFAFIKTILTDEKYKEKIDDLNIIIVPEENVDSVAMHYELQKEHPTWQLHSCYTNSLGTDLMAEYFKKNTIHTEAKAFSEILDTYLPDAIMDLHGVPLHEMPVQFNQIVGYKGLWIPRALICTFYFHVDDPRFTSNKGLCNGWSNWTVGYYKDWPEFRKINETLEKRFEKYSYKGIDESFSSEWNDGILTYWVPSKFNKNHPYPTVSRPWMVSAMITTEAADETASGEWLGNCSRAHLRQICAGVDFLSQSGAVVESKTIYGVGDACIKYMRHRPLLSSRVK